MTQRHRHDPPWSAGGGPPWIRRRRRGFGCVFAVVFFVVAASMLAAAVVIFSRLGLIAGVITFVVVVVSLTGVARSFRRTGQQLDTLVEAIGRVEAGDYTVRVGTPERAMSSMRDLSRGFDTMVERLEADKTQRRRLLADVSHELRTPLAIIAGNIEAMIDGVHPTDDAHLSVVLEETRVMERLIEDLRTLALSEAGTLRLHREMVDIGELMDDVVRSFEGAAGPAGVTVRAVVQDMPVILDVDPVRIREVLANLVANAIRHTPRNGDVALTASIADPWLEILVSDTGPGIDPKVLPHLFDRFVSTSGATGSGLGLAIARSLAEAHGGSLEVAATGSAGTSFRLRLPMVA